MFTASWSLAWLSGSSKLALVALVEDGGRCGLELGLGLGLGLGLDLSVGS